MAITVAELVATLGLDDKAFDRGMDGVGRSFGRIGPMAAAAGAAAGAALAAGLAKAMDVEAINDKLAAQLDLTEAESKRIGGVAGRLYADAYGESMEEVSTAVDGVRSSIEGMAEASEEELEAVTVKALDLAATFDYDVTRAASSAGIVMKSGLARDGEEAFDLIAAASQRVPAQLREDILDAADEYSQFFATLGMDGEQAFALLVDASEKGMYGIDKVGDAVKEFTIRSTDLSSASKEAYEAIGLSAEEMTNKILAGGQEANEATQQVIDGLLAIEDPGEQAAASIALFGTPIEDLNVAEIPDFLRSLQSGSDAMEGFAGASERMGETLNDNAKTKVTAFKRTVETKFVNFLGNTVIPAIEKTADVLGPILAPAFRAVGDVIKPIAPVLIALAGAFTGLWAAVKGYRLLKSVIGTVRDLTGVVRDGVRATLNFASGLSRAGSAAGGPFASGMSTARGGAGRLGRVLGKGGALGLALAFTTAMIFKAVDAWSQYNAAAKQAESAYQGAKSTLASAEQYIIEKYGAGSERHKRWQELNKGAGAKMEATRYEKPWWDVTAWFAEGGDFIARSPQIIGVGDVAERVTITPLSGDGAGGHGRSTVINISGIPSRRQLEQLKRDLAAVDIGNY